MGYIVSMHIGLAQVDESDDNADKDAHGSNKDNGHSLHHFVLVYIRRSSPLQAQH